MFRQRTDFHFKTARRLCEQYAVICLETLDLQAIGKRHGRKINSLAFYDFVQTLSYEATKTGTKIIFLDRYYPSSQLCHVCGFKNTALKDERIRSWDCPSCGTHHDRDRNAAMNILRAGVSALGGEPLSAAASRQALIQQARFSDSAIRRLEPGGVHQVWASAFFFTHAKVSHITLRNCQ